jgi:ribosomal protein S12 methylthiotransferase accessory factor
VACVIQRPSPSKPSVAVGAGVDTRLIPAMYKALIEAVGVMQLAKINMVNAEVEGRLDGSFNPEQILDLDTNVAYYAWPEHAGFIDRKFGRAESVAASELPLDSDLPPEEEVDEVVARFERSGKELIELDLTTDDIRDLGFVALRVWSPDLLSIPLPSAPPMKHYRFEAYGGARHGRPHPYP